MKWINLIWIIVFVTVGFDSIAQKQKETMLIPLAIGNYWIYSTNNTLHPFDTLRIVGTKIIDGDTAFLYNDGELIFERNDSFYDYQTQRIGSTFKCFQYFPSDKKLDYSISVGGD